MEMLNQKQKIILIIGIIIAAIIIGYYYINSTKEVYNNYTELGNIVEEENIEENETTTNEIIEEEIIVHVAGAVEKNGIVKLKPNARIVDAIEAAGGLADGADLTEVNLAYTVQDGQKIYIPSVEEKNTKEIINKIITEGGGNVIVGSIEENSKSTGKININKATATELMNIPGVGEVTAAKIIEYRETQGTFKTIEDIKNVSGIGDAKFNAMKEYITV